MLQKEILKQFLMMKAGINNAYTVLFFDRYFTIYIDTAIGLLIPMHIGKFELVFVPHLTFMYILMMVVYRGFGVSLLLSIFLGVMTDVYFGSIYGVYLFGYILFLALIDRFFKIFYKDHSMLFIIILASTLLLEVYVALIYGMLGFIQFDIIHFVVFRLLPTLIMNFVLLIMLYPLIIKFLKKTNNDIDMKRRQW